LCVKAKSEQGRAAASKNLYPHRLGSGGYKTATMKWKKNKDVLPSTSNSSGLSEEENNRAYNWFMARTKKDAERGIYFPDEATRMAFQRMVHYSIFS
jgi:hypothetical protein